MNRSQLETEVDALLKGPQYALPQRDKQERLLPLVRSLAGQIATGCPEYQRFLDRLAPPAERWQTLADVPPLPVTMFKHFTLRAVPAEAVVRELHSSTTTGQMPSRIFIDKLTAFRQARALVAQLREHVGGQRRPYLVLDTPAAVNTGQELTARGAGIRGVGHFASQTVFALRPTVTDGMLEPDFDALERFCAEHGSGPVLLFGFTFMIWTRFVVAAEQRGLRLHLPQAILLHSGGWKKLASQAVAKEEFTARTAAVLGCPPENLLDFYGMIEQVGTVFVDCSAGHKHAPAFADVLLRRPHTLAPAAVGEEGIIEVLSVLPTSYPGLALLTEDQGVVMGEDDCPCGRRGRYFRFTRRVERAEVRGCGDTFAQARERA